MKKTIIAVMTTMLVTSCVGDIAQKVKSLINGEAADSAATIVALEVKGGDDGQAADQTEDIKDLPLLVASDGADWFAPVGFTPSGQMSADEYAALSEEEMEKENDRGERETAAFIDMLKKNKERYNMVLDNGKWREVDYLESNFDRGESSTFAMGWKDEERKDHMKYVRYHSKDGKKRQFEGFAMLFTKRYVDSHQLENVTDNEVSMPEDVFNEIQQRTGKNITQVPYGYAIGSDIKYFVVLFAQKDNKAFAAHAVATPQGVAISDIEESELDEDGNPSWAVDMEGEYPHITILTSDKKDGVLKLWYLDTAPEHACLGSFIVKGKKLERREYSQNYMWN